jgi:hypothetical protein
MTRSNPLLNNVADAKGQHVASVVSALVGLVSKCIVIFISILGFSLLDAVAANNTALQQKLLLLNYWFPQCLVQLTE